MGQRGRRRKKGATTRVIGRSGGGGWGDVVGGGSGVGGVLEGSGGVQMVQLQAKHYFSLLNKRFHGEGRCLAETAECHER